VMLAFASFLVAAFIRITIAVATNITPISSTSVGIKSTVATATIASTTNTSSIFRLLCFSQS
jgi:hypothetical protein